MASKDSTSIWKPLAVITGLAAVAFVAPILDIYGRNPEVFVANRTTGSELFLFAFVVGLFIPALALLALAIARLVGPTAFKITYRVLIGVLSLATGFVVARQIVPDETLLAIGMALAVAGLLYWLSTVIDSVFALAAVAVPVLIAMFLATSPTAGLIWEEPEQDGEAVAIEAPSHLVMIQLDEMPVASIMRADGSINDDLFPGFARLAELGTWYRNALSDSIATTQSVPAILTGTKSNEDKKPTYLDHPNNLFTLLQDSHEMHVIEWVAELCPEEICPDYAGRAPALFGNLLADVGVVYGHLTLPGDTREQLPSIGNAWKGFLGQTNQVEGSDVEIEGLPVPPEGQRPDWVTWVQRLINGIKAGTEPTLSYAHLRTPHVPWEANPSGTHYERPEEYTEVFGVEGDGRWSLDPGPALLGFQRHLYQVGFLDTMLLRLLDHIEDSSTWDETMIVVVADHGASFTPGEHRRWPYEDNRDDLYRVPLFIKYPDQSVGETVDLPVFGVDLMPTIVDVMDIDTDWSFNGTSLLDLDRERPHEPIRWCCNGTGVNTNIAALLAQVEANHARVPDQSSWESVTAVGDGAQFVGMRISDIGASSEAGFTYSLDLGTSLNDVEVSSGEVQTLLTGRVAGDVGDTLLIGVNDVIAGVALLNRDSTEGGSFIGLVGESWVFDGSNQVTLYSLDADQSLTMGLPTELDLVLRAPDGREIDVVTEGSLRVQVDEVTATVDGYQMIGWGADTRNKVPPDVFYVFVGDQLIASTEPNRDNRNVVGWFDSEDLLRSGFSLEISRDDIPDGVDRVTVVAEYGEKAVADSVGLSSRTAEG